jgi:hypothetical protein
LVLYQKLRESTALCGVVHVCPPGFVQRIYKLNSRPEEKYIQILCRIQQETEGPEEAQVVGGGE